MAHYYTLSEAWSGVNWADLMAAQRTFGTDFYDRSILRPKHRAYNRSCRPVIKIGPKGALGSHEIHPIHSAPSLGQSILSRNYTGCPGLFGNRISGESLRNKNIMGIHGSGNLNFVLLLMFHSDTHSHSFILRYIMKPLVKSL